jgi:hypothetical protein
MCLFSELKLLVNTCENDQQVEKKYFRHLILYRNTFVEFKAALQ